MIFDRIRLGLIILTITNFLVQCVMFKPKIAFEKKLPLNFFGKYSKGMHGISQILSNFPDGVESAILDHAFSCFSLIIRCEMFCFIDVFTVGVIAVQYKYLSLLSGLNHGLLYYWTLNSNDFNLRSGHTWA